MLAVSRRSILQLASSVIPLHMLSGLAIAQPSSPAAALPVPDSFPSHPPEMVREMVIVSHFDQQRARELVEMRPALARAAWDWGFGDWETALGAASHMGNRAIAEYLITKGAGPSLFSAAMLGHLDVVKAFIAASPGVQQIRGPHSITLLAHARVGGAAARSVFEFLQSLDGVDQETPAPLSSEEASALVGTFVFGVGVADKVDIDADTKMYASSKMYSHPPQLNWTRKGTMPRPLFHLGNHTFYPAGAPSVRVRFTQEPNAVLMTVNDPDVVLTARLKKS